MSGSITFVGAGPGAADLITVRGREKIDAADVIVYAGSLVDERLMDRSRAEKYNSARMNFDEVMEILVRSWREGKQVVRLHTGDPAMYGAVGEQYRALDALGIPYEVVPGVSSVFAAAAALKVEFTMPGVSQTAILTRDAGRTPVPEKENLQSLAAHGSTLCLFLSVGDLEEVVRKVLAGGRPPETPAAVVYRAGWENQQIVRGTLEDIAERVRQAGIRRQAMIVIGEVLNHAGTMSSLYDRDFVHGYRRKNGFSGRCAVFALTSAGIQKAAEIAAGIDAVVMVPEKFRCLVAEERARPYQPDAGPAVCRSVRSYVRRTGDGDGGGNCHTGVRGAVSPQDGGSGRGGRGRERTFCGESGRRTSRRCKPSCEGCGGGHLRRGGPDNRKRCARHDRGR